MKSGGCSSRDSAVEGVEITTASCESAHQSARARAAARAAAVGFCEVTNYLLVTGWLPAENQVLLARAAFDAC
jgi:hypothetical protein